MAQEVIEDQAGVVERLVQGTQNRRPAVSTRLRELLDSGIVRVVPRQIDRPSAQAVRAVTVQAGQSRDLHGLPFHEHGAVVERHSVDVPLAVAQPSRCDGSRPREYDRPVAFLPNDLSALFDC